MVLIEKNSYLFTDPMTGEFNPEIVREFLKADDLTNNQFMGLVYDWSDYQEFR